jgi:hypothetical protein
MHVVSALQACVGLAEKAHPDRDCYRPIVGVNIPVQEMHGKR